MGLDRETIITLGSALPPAIGIFGRLEALLRKTDSGLDEIIELVRVDPALTFQIIRLSNSAFYGMKSRCDSLEQAVARIGFADIHSLVGLVAARHTCQKDLPAYQVSAQLFWENAVATSQVMAALAARNGTDARNAYSTGLLRTIGRVVINNYARAVRYPGEAAAPDIFAWEKATYGVDAAEVGATLLEYWRFSPDTVAAVASQCNPASAAALALPAATLHVAGAVSAGWGHGLPGENSVWRHDADMLALAGLSDDAVAAAMTEAAAGYVRVAGIKWAAAA